jgi:hypothetical protein
MAGEIGRGRGDCRKHDASNPYGDAGQKTFQARHCKSSVQTQGTGRVQLLLVEKSEAEARGSRQVWTGGMLRYRIIIVIVPPRPNTKTSRPIPCHR